MTLARYILQTSSNTIHGKHTKLTSIAEMSRQNVSFRTRIRQGNGRKHSTMHWELSGTVVSLPSARTNWTMARPMLRPDRAGAHMERLRISSPRCATLRSAASSAETCPSGSTTLPGEGRRCPPQGACINAGISRMMCTYICTYCKCINTGVSRM